MLMLFAIIFMQIDVIYFDVTLSWCCYFDVMLMLFAIMFMLFDVVLMLL